MLTRRSFLSLMLPAAALLSAAWPEVCPGNMPATFLPVREMTGIIRQKSFFADDAWDAALLQEASLQGSAAGVTDCLRRFDRYASYTTTPDLARMKSLMADHPAGVGMDIFEDRQKRVRCVPYPGSAAESAGILYGDILKGVDGQAVRDKALGDIALAIRGESGTVVVLAVHGEGGPMRTVVAERTPGSFPTVIRTRISPPVLRIYRFARQTPQELASCLEDLPDGEGCIIDLRGNTGGNMEAGVECARLFLRKGETALRLKSRSSTRNVTATRNGKWAGLPLSLVQDRFTASAAELFIAALTSAGRARSHGSQSAGKSCVQNLFTLSDGSVLKLTTEKMLYPGREDDWEGVGIPPSPPEDPRPQGAIHAQ